MGNTSVLVLTICILLSANFVNEIGGHGHHNHAHGQAERGKVDSPVSADATPANFSSPSLLGGGNVEDFFNGTGLRNKRNTGGSSTENQLATCQLTNILLYQALQQQRQVNSNPLLALATSNLQGLGSSLNLNLGQNPPSPGGFGLTGPGNLLNPLAALNQNLVYPSLQTYVTTSTYVTKMTTTALVTIGLLFGNKPSSTLVTRTKTYDVTTSAVQTLTSTITPTLVTPQIQATPVLSQSDAVIPTPSVVQVGDLGQKKVGAKSPEKDVYDVYEDDTQYVNDVVEEKRAPNKKIFLRGTSPSTTARQEAVDQYVSPSKPSKTSSRGTTTFTSSADKKQRRKSRPTAAATETQRSPTTSTSNKYSSRDDIITKSQRQNQQYQAPTPQADYDYYGTAYGSAGAKRKSPGSVGQEQFYNRQYGSSIQEDDNPVEDDPAAVQYPDDYSYYNRRLKRGEQNGEEGDEEYTKLDREYLLEPSSDGDYSGNYQKYEKCPPIPPNNLAQSTVTVTETKTITKFLKGQGHSATPALGINTNLYAGSTSRTFIPSGGLSGSRRGSYKKNPEPEVATTTSSRRGYYTTSAPQKSRNRDYTSNAPTSTASSVGISGDPRAQILRRGKTRYNPSEDYEYYNNRG